MPKSTKKGGGPMDAFCRKRTKKSTGSSKAAKPTRGKSEATSRDKLVLSEQPFYSPDVSTLDAPEKPQTTPDTRKEVSFTEFFTSFSPPQPAAPTASVSSKRSADMDSLLSGGIDFSAPVATDFGIEDSLGSDVVGLLGWSAMPLVGVEDVPKPKPKLVKAQPKPEPVKPKPKLVKPQPRPESAKPAPAHVCKPKAPPKAKRSQATLSFGAAKKFEPGKKVAKKKKKQEPAVAVEPPKPQPRPSPKRPLASTVGAKEVQPKSPKRRRVVPSIPTAPARQAPPVKPAMMTNALWTVKYAPSTVADIIGNQNIVRTLIAWLSAWMEVYDKPKTRKATAGVDWGSDGDGWMDEASSAPRPSGGMMQQMVPMGSRSAPSRPTGVPQWGPSNPPPKAALLSGPPGIGKTTTAALVAKHLGFTILEFNASDCRNKSALDKHLSQAAGSRFLPFSKADTGSGKGKFAGKRVLIMDEVDGMSSGDRGGMKALQDVVRTTKTPMICICNNRFDQKVKTLAKMCLDLQYQRPTEQELVQRLAFLCHKESLAVDQQSLLQLVRGVGGDIRQTVNVLQMVQTRHRNFGGGDCVQEELMRAHKDAILRLTLQSSVQALMQPMCSSLQQRWEAFFVDYSMLPYWFEQNCFASINSVQGEPYQRKLFRLESCLNDLSLADIIETKYKSKQNYALLPVQAAFTVSAGVHAAGQQGMAPALRFPDYFGKNSARQKRMRLLKEMQFHMTGAISGWSEFRLFGLETMRRRVLTPMIETASKVGAQESVTMTLQLGLSRDDVFDSLPDLQLFPDSKDVARRAATVPEKIKLCSMHSIPGAVKSAYTRLYNAQAVATQAKMVKDTEAAKMVKKTVISTGKKRRKTKPANKKAVAKKKS